MGSKKFYVLVILVIVSSFIGGVFSEHFLSAKAEATKENTKAIIAQAFHLVDKDGKHRGSFGLTKEGHPILLFYNEASKPIAYFSVARSTPILEFMDERGNTRISMALGKDGSPGLFFADGKRKQKIGINVGENGDSGIMLFDRDNIARMMIMVQDKSPRIAFVEGMKSVDFALTTRPDGQGGMVMQNKHGQIVLGMYNNAPVLSLKKSDGTESITGFFPTGQPFTGLRENGKTIWIAPQGKQTEMQEITPSSDWQKITDSLLQPPKF